MTRDEQCLTAIARFGGPVTATRLARLLNLHGPCDWCPVGKPATGERCATVPRASAARCARVIARLVAAGVLVDLNCHRHPLYVPGAA